MKDSWGQIRAEVGGRLRPYGFTQSRQGFINVQNREVVQQLSIEKYRWNTPGDQRFALNLSLYFATGDAGEFTFKGLPERYSLVFQKNIGYLWGDENHLYRVPATGQFEGLFAEIGAQMSAHLLPALQRCATIDATVAFLDQEHQKHGESTFAVVLAIALARLGRKEESREHFRRSQGDTALIRQLAQQHGVELDDTPPS